MASYLLGLHLIAAYKPTVAQLQRTTPVTGKLRIVDQGRGGFMAELNGIPLMCRVT